MNTNISEKAKKLLEEIRQTGEEYPVAALKADFDQQQEWFELVKNNLVNCWEGDDGTEYVDVGPFETGGIERIPGEFSAYGIGRTEAEARASADGNGFGGEGVAIKEEGYYLVTASGNPDAVMKAE
jgi:hypothetical protein